jgi:hypothetical protein
MSKKTNTWLFILGGTVFNILVTIIAFLLLLFVYARFLAPTLPESTAQWALIVVFLGAIALSFVTYRVALKQIMKRIDMDKYFDPIFGPRKRTLRKD